MQKSKNQQSHKKKSQKIIYITHETYLNQIGREWVEAGLIQDCTRGDDI